MVKKRICIFTGTRAEYGLLKPLMDELKGDKSVKLQVLVSGMHLSKEFGLTYKEIEKDGFAIDEKVDIKLNSDTPQGISKSTGLGTINYAKAYLKLKPDMIIVLGDRFEAFAAVTAAMISRIPIAHLYGGEATFGLIDEAIRHSITKMSQLHFTSVPQYRNRIIQLGEDPRRVFNVGAIGLDNIKKLPLLSKQELENDLKIKFDKRNILVTFHPVTLESKSSRQQFQNLLDVLDELKDTFIIFTKANADTEGRVINKMIDTYTRKNSYKAKVFASLGQLRYLSTLRYVDAVVGNSSSGIIEAASFKIGTINIGDRQAGRLRAKNIIDVDASKNDIRKGFKKLYSKKFQESLKKIKNPYGDGLSAKRIKKLITKYPLKDILKKSFYDLGPNNGKKSV